MKKRWLFFAILILSCTSNPAPGISRPIVPTNIGIPSGSHTTSLAITQPSWFQDPKSNILMLSGVLSTVFVDPVTSEDIVLGFENAEWIDNNHVGFSSFLEPVCPSGTAYGKIFNLSKWEVEEIDTDTSKILEFCKPDVTENTIKVQDNELSLFDEETKTWKTFLNILPDQIVHEFLMIDGKIYVLEGSASSEAEDVIKIYDVGSKKVLKTFNGEVAKNKIKYSERLNVIVYFSKNNVCFIELDDLERDCKTMLPEVYEDAELEYFLASGKVLFSYDTSPHVNYNIRTVCVFTIGSDQIKCPTANLKIFTPRIEYTNEQYEINKTWSVIDAKVSPDEKWLAICYGLDFPDGYIGLAFVDLNGQNYKVIDDTFFKGFFLSFCDQYKYVYSEYTWRPMP